MKTKWLIILLCLGGLSQAANLIKNGSFELPGTFVPQNGGWEPVTELGLLDYATVSGQWYYGEGTTVPVDNWTRTRRVWLLIERDQGQVVDGKYAMRIDCGSNYNGVDKLSQGDLNLVAGTNYELSFYIWGENNQAQVKIDAALSGPAAVTILDDYTTVGNDGKAELVTADFMISVSGVYTLELFIAPGTTGSNDSNHATIDDVKIDLSPRAYNPVPANKATVALSTSTLSWTKPDPNIAGNTITSDVYFGTDPNMINPHYGLSPVAGAQDITASSISIPKALAQDKAYYWVVDSRDPSRNPKVSSGKLWYFNTVADKQVAHWTLDSDANGKYTDSSGEGHHATVTGDPNNIPGVNPAKTGSAVIITADKGVGNAGTWNPSYLTNKLTLSCWVKWNKPASGNQAIIAKANDWQNPGIMWEIFCNSDGGIQMLAGAGSVSLPSGTLTADEWQFIALSYDGVNATLYSIAVNDPSVRMISNTAAVTLGSNTDATVWIGARGSDASTPTEIFTGAIDEIQLFNYAQDAFGIVDLYNQAVTKNFCVKSYASSLDVVNDCIINLNDIAAISAKWLDCGLYPNCK